MTYWFRRLSLILLLSGLLVRPAFAQSGIQTLASTATVHFPTDISFRLQARSAAHIAKVTLLYGIIGRACDDSQAQQALAFTPSSSVDVNWQLKFANVGVLPPGVQVWWQWQIQDDAGAQLLTDRQTQVVTDAGYPWHTLTRQSVTVTWSQGSQAFGTQMLDQAISSLDRLNRQLGVRPPGSVALVIYPTAAAVRQALVYVPEWTGGVAFPQYDTTVIGVAPGENAWAASVIPHELAHLVVGALTFNCRGIDLPTWLNEGLAVVSQGPASPQDLATLSVALRGGALPTLRSLANGFQADAAQAAVSYTRSGQVVNYLIATYGADRLSALLAAMQAGNPIDSALGQIYGLDTDGVDNAWRVSQGAPPLPTVVAQVTPGQSTAVPTLALWTAVPPATATAVPSLQPSPSPVPAEPVITSSPPAPTPASTPSAVPPVVHRSGAAPLAPLLLLGGAGVLLAGLVLAALALGLWLLKAKT